MPRMGLGLGIDKQRAMKSLTQELIDAGCVLYLDASKATGTSVGINSPLTNPWVDLSKKGNSATLVNVAGTSSDGYTTRLLANGKTLPFFKPDGVDTLATLANNASIDITGTKDFAIGCLIQTPAVVTDGYVISKRDTTIATSQYQLAVLAGNAVRLDLQGATAYASDGTFFVGGAEYAILFIRVSGVLYVYKNKIEVASVANVSNITTRQNARLFAAASNIEGTTHVSYLASYVSKVLLFNPTSNVLNKTKVVKLFDSVCKDYL